MRKLIISMIVVTLFVVAGGLAAWAHHPAPAPDPDTPPCDRITGGGFIPGATSGKANFGFVAGCQKNFRDDDDDDDDGDDDDRQRHAPRFGSLEFTDKDYKVGVVAFPVKLRAQITAYFPHPGEDGTTTSSSRDRRGTRFICGEGRTSSFGDVEWVARVSDNGEPGRNRDDFLIQIKSKPAVGNPPGSGAIVYENANMLHGGNIELHKPPKHSSPNGFSDFATACPQL